MKNIIAKVLTDQATEVLEVVSLEEEIHHITAAELCRTEVVSEMGDSSRTLELINALESLAIVADTIRQPSPQEAALIQIAGDTALAGTGLSGNEITPSMEDEASGTTVSAKVRSAIEQILRALKELLARITAVVRKYIQHARAAAGGHVQRQKVIKERLMAASHSLNSEQEFTMSMPIADGKTLTSLSEVVNEALKFSVLVDWFVNKGTAFNIDYSSGFVDLYAKLGGGEDGITVIDQFAILNKIADLTGHIANSVPHSHLKSDVTKDYFTIKTQQSVQLLGGVSISVTSATPIEHNTGLSSASIKHAVQELTEVGFRVQTEAGGFYKESFLTRPLNQAELHKAFDVAGILIEHFTAKSDHTALAAATARRSEFAETAVDHLTRYTEKFKKNDIAAKEYGSSALRIGQSVLTNATVPYTQMTTAVSRVINLLQSAMLKSLNAHEAAHGGTDAKKAQPSNEDFTELAYSAEGIVSGLIDFLLGKKGTAKKDDHQSASKPSTSMSEFEAVDRWITENVMHGELNARCVASEHPFKLGAHTASYMVVGGKALTTADALVSQVAKDLGLYMGIFRKVQTRVLKANKVQRELHETMWSYSKFATELKYPTLKGVLVAYKSKLGPAISDLVKDPGQSVLGLHTTPLVKNGEFELIQGGEAHSSSIEFEGVDTEKLNRLVHIALELGAASHQVLECQHQLLVALSPHRDPFNRFSGQWDDEGKEALRVLTQPYFGPHYTDIINALWARIANLEFTLWTVIRHAVTKA